MRTPKEHHQMTELEKQEHREIMKEAIQEWMDSKWLKFAKWSVTGIAASLFGWLMMYLFTHGIKT